VGGDNRRYRGGLRGSLGGMDVLGGMGLSHREIGGGNARYGRKFRGLR